MTLIVAVVLIALILVLFALLGNVRQRSSVEAPPPVVTPEPQEEVEAREARHQRVDRRGSELIERRVELDARRGTLGGDTELLEALNRLEDRRRNGEISEQEFEAEKVRLLGG